MLRKNWKNAKVCKVVQKCPKLCKSWKSVPMPEKVWESVPKDQNVWESVLKLEQVHPNLRNNKKVSKTWEQESVLKHEKVLNKLRKY